MRTDRRKFLQASLGALAVGSHLPAAFAADDVPCAIVLGPNAHQLERKAALELQRYFLLLFAFAPSIVPSAETSASAVILLGSVSNPVIRQAAGDSLPELTDQGFLLRKISFNKKPALLVVGGSAIATSGHPVCSQVHVLTFPFLPLQISHWRGRVCDATNDPKSAAKRRWWIFDLGVIKSRAEMACQGLAKVLESIRIAGGLSTILLGRVGPILGDVL